MMVSFDQASSFFIENPELFTDFVLTRLNNSQKSKLLTILKEDVLKRSSISRGSFDSKDESSAYYKPIKRPARNIMVDHSIPKKWPPVNRVTTTMSQYRKSDDSTICSCKIKTDSYKSMGLFVNQRNLPSVLEGNYDEAVESFSSSEPRMKIKRRPENRPFSRIFFTTAKPPNFLQVTEEEPLAGYSFENADPNDLGKGVRLASSTARSELSAVTASQLPMTTAKKRPGSILKESIDSMDLSGRSHLPDTMRHLIERIIKRQYSQHEIIQTTTSVLTEHADVDVIHLHLREKNDEVRLLKSTCSSQFAYQLPSQKSTFCTPFTAAFWSGNMIIANFVMRDVRWEKDKLFYDVDTKHSIAYPLFSINGNVFAVIELLRLKGRPPFDDKSVKFIYSTLLAMQTIMLLKEKVNVEHSITAYSILSKKMAGIMLSQIMEMDVVMNIIMTYAKQIVQAEKCVLFLVDLEKQELISTIGDHGSLYQTKFVNVEPIRVPLNVGVFGHVIHTSECLVTNDPQSTDDFYHHEGIFSENFRILNMVTAPIRVRNEVVAVLQLFNKTPGEFDTNDVENIKDFSVFCGLALYISKMYEKMFRSEQKCRITMEIMLHHNLASDSDVVEYSVREIPNNIPGITEPLFSPWHMPDEEMPAVFIYMVHDVMGKSVIDLHTLIRFTLTVRKNYRDVIYHNWFHGFSVAHGAYVEIKREDCNFTQVEKLCILIAALCHDLDHRGTDNSYQRKKGTPLATLYSTSILEHHHFNMTLTILQQPGNQIFAHVAGTSYYEILMIIKHAILSTDLGRLDASKEVVTDILDKRGAIDWDNKDHRMATVAIALPVADLCSMYKPWEVHKKVVLLVMEEMWAQGDEEKKNGFIPMDLMNRDLYYQIPEMQSNFYKVVCLPLFRLITRAIPSLMDIPNQAFANFSRWMEMCLLPESVKRERVNELIQRRSQRTTATTDSI
ncbi:cAMP and cAMP inhibited cGMP 3'5' cyclic [Echinococcus multilocularis]|uniref:Phosphodiesterase n=1 Tax=Echinococcus multilocularis TaxID=6211 RepID=A0A068Y621_ECHMU|nr:cAMP and cAMP inhibited cGMP 3'5' cyclic [Echinococcus multilocularis]